MEIFENGLLKNEFINRNYRGLVGWKIDYEYNLVAVRNRRAMSINANDDLHNTVTETVNIKQFTVEEIPVGELCWMGDGSGEWVLCPFGGVKKRWLNGKKEINRFIASDESYEGIIAVPYIVAETKEDAEKLKDLFTR